MTTQLVGIARGAAMLRAMSTFTVCNYGQITMAGLRTPQTVAEIAAIDAVNQVSDETMALVLSEHIFQKRY